MRAFLGLHLQLNYVTVQYTINKGIWLDSFHNLEFTDTFGYYVPYS